MRYLFDQDDMSVDLPRTEAGLRQRRADALARMRTAARLAYFHGGLLVIVYLMLGYSTGDWLTPANYLVTGLVVAGLGLALYWPRSAAAAAALVALVLGLTILQLVAGGRTPAILIVAIFAWKYGQAFYAAREYAALEDLAFDAAPA
jgi:hypothetical protein